MNTKINVMGICGIIISISIVLGCSRVHPFTPNETTYVETNNNWIDNRVSFSLYTNEPLLPQSPSTHIGYGRAQQKDLIWTVKHLLPESLERLRLQNAEGEDCVMKQIRLHDSYDLALIQTSSACVSADGLLRQAENAPSEVIYLDGTLKKSPLIAAKQKFIGYLSGSFAPGMSGTPLFGINGQCVGLLVADTPLGGEVILLHPSLLQGWKAIQNI